MTDVAYRGSNRRQTYALDQRAYRMTMAAVYPFFFASALARRLNPFVSRSANRSLLAETRASAAAIVPFIFMG